MKFLTRDKIYFVVSHSGFIFASFAYTSKAKQTTEQLSDLFIHSKLKGKLHNFYEINQPYSVR